ncbi:hypothetical protein AVEN_115084-1 [Araneus ventricosus]|uniref:Reverse transcriptase domain-containing protein n=1 Tax=Araneus ventricosus TaxID=182803 RepID=A0A4Y1ZX51_ARAVE|nr:hypothetical protein AVEN_115084-1 [Araneus ventricosus]
MIRFPKHVCTLRADVKMMYRKLLIRTSQHSLKRVLWTNNVNCPPKMSHGTVSALYLAVRTLLQLSKYSERRLPLSAPVLSEKFYMDDILYGVSTLAEAKELKCDLVAILQSIGRNVAL